MKERVHSKFILEVEKKNKHKTWLMGLGREDGIRAVSKFVICTIG